MGYLSNTAHSYYSGTNLGNYQYLELSEIIDNFTATYVGEGKILQGVLKGDVSFHAHRALAELTYDTFKSCKSQEITLPPSLVMPLPQDYVNYVKLTWSDANGIEHVIYPTSKTSNPNSVPQDSDGNYMFYADWPCPSFGGGEDPAGRYVPGEGCHPTNPGGLIQFPYVVTTIESLAVGTTTIIVFQHILGYDPTTALNPTSDPHGYENFPDTNPYSVGMEIISPYFPAGTTITSITEATGTADASITLSHASTNTAVVTTPISIGILDKNDTWSNYSSGPNATIGINNTLDPAVDNSNYFTNSGERYGLDPQYAQANGSFFIDCVGGKIHFGSNLSGKTIILKYISDSLGTDKEMVVPKLAEEAVYKWILYGCLVARAGVPAGALAMAKKEKSTETRKAKLRLSNVKIEEITQIFRGKSKWIKH